MKYDHSFATKNDGCAVLEAHARSRATEARAAEDALDTGVVVLAVEAEVVRAHAVVPVVAEPVSARACSRTSRSV